MRLLRMRQVRAGRHQVTVWVVEVSGYEWSKIRGIFTTEERAREIADTLRKRGSPEPGWSVTTDEYELDEALLDYVYA